VAVVAGATPLALWLTALELRDATHPRRDK